MASCVIISDIPRHRIIVSYAGDKLLWQWKDGLICPGSNDTIDIHPLAAETLVIEEITTFLRMEGVDTNEIIYLNPDGERVDGIFLCPPGVSTFKFDDVFKKEKIKELYWRFIQDGDKLTEEIVGEAIASSVLGPFLTLVNL